MVRIAACWHTRVTVVIRMVLVVTALAAALMAGLMVYSKSGHSQAPAPACTVAGCTNTDGTLPGGWPTDPNHVP
jgi:hypothetical protein